MGPRIGVLGGTFDPVHLGHLHCAEHVREVLALESLLLLPCAVPPHKDPPRLAPASHRRSMLELAIRDLPRLELCTLELETGRVCYTIDSLRRLQRRRPDARLLFLLGMDGLIELQTWRSYRQLLSGFDLLALDRPGLRLRDVRQRLDPAVEERLRELPADARAAARVLRESSEPGGQLFHLAMRTIPISSSEVRARVAEGRSIDGLVPTAVAGYIFDHRLYRREDER